MLKLNAVQVVNVPEKSKDGPGMFFFLKGQHNLKNILNPTVDPVFFFSFLK